ncbi:MAG: radical SAM protein [Candidatus Eisenbacteria bacterium]|nr:radical SAM protein [Candidatus Eisenbacteria bacterium]
MSHSEDRLSSIRRPNDVGDLVGLALWRWGRTSPRRLSWVARRATRLLLAELKRVLHERRLGAPVPRVVAISPTMKCDYDCHGCYSRGRSTENELTPDELDTVLSEAERLGVLSIVVTGGEPLLRADLLGTARRHPGLLFVLITNGSHLTPDVASLIASAGNIVTLVSVEGFRGDTDERRRQGAHDAALRALRFLHEAGLCHGFAAMNTPANSLHLVSDEFLEQMEDLGCSMGFLTEYVPTGGAARADYVVDREERKALRSRVLQLRRLKKLVLIQFPHDEYGKKNICSAAGRQSLHIGSSGDVEPCPFVTVSCDNIRDGGLEGACKSAFLHAIRERQHLLRRDRCACALFEHRMELDELAEKMWPEHKREPL